MKKYLYIVLCLCFGLCCLATPQQSMQGEAKVFFFLSYSDGDRVSKKTTVRLVGSDSQSYTTNGPNAGFVVGFPLSSRYTVSISAPQLEDNPAIEYSFPISIGGIIPGMTQSYSMAITFDEHGKPLSFHTQIVSVMPSN